MAQICTEKEQKDLVRAFSVVSPNVNYPPATLSETHSTHENVCPVLTVITPRRTILTLA